MCKSMITPSIEDVKHLQIPLHDISLATNGFAGQNLIAKGGFGKVYKGASEKHGDVAIKRLDHGHGQGDHEFKTEIALLSKYKHQNIVSLLGFCDEDGEKILVYKYESNGSLDKHLDNMCLTWIQRLCICLDAARGLRHVHDNDGSQNGIFHRDVKSSNILLDANWRAKISDFGLSRVNSASMQSSFVISNACGTPGYIDPDYYMNGYLTEKSDVYSFGVVLWEVLCGRHALVTMYKDQRRFLPLLARNHYKKGTLDMIIHSNLLGQMKTASLLMFSNIALQCLKNGEERPTMKQVVEQLEKVVHSQMISTMSFSIVEVKPLQIPFQEILVATNGFANSNLITTGRSGNVYEGISEQHGHIAIHRLDRGQGLGKHEFMTKVTLLSERKHEHIVTFLGFCDDGVDKILVYKYESNGSLDKHLDSKDLSWFQRLCICLDVACGLKFIHNDVDRITHPEFNSSHIFLDVDWKAKVSYLWQSSISPLNMQRTYVSTNPPGTPGYIDPNYFIHNDSSNEKRDVYSFGILLWEVLCGRLAHGASDKEDPQSLPTLVREHYETQALDRIIPSFLYKQINTVSLRIFTNIAHRCLKKEEERPTMKQVEERLQKALNQQILSDLHQDVSIELDLKAIVEPSIELDLKAIVEPSKELMTKDQTTKHPLFFIWKIAAPNM